MKTPVPTTSLGPTFDRLVRDVMKLPDWMRAGDFEDDFGKLSE